MARLSLHGVLTQTFIASTMYGFIIDSGSVTLTTGSAGGAFIAKLTGSAAESFDFGAPIGLPPPGSPIVAAVSATTVYCTIWYK